MPPEISPEDQRVVIASWKWRWARLGMTATKVADALKIHQGNLCDWANQKTEPKPNNFQKVENWNLKQEKKSKII